MGAGPGAGVLRPCPLTPRPLAARRFCCGGRRVPLPLPAPFPGFSLVLALVGVPGESQSRAWPSLGLSFWPRIGSRAVLGLSRRSQPQGRRWWLRMGKACGVATGRFRLVTEALDNPNQLHAPLNPAGASRVCRRGQSAVGFWGAGWGALCSAGPGVCAAAPVARGAESTFGAGRDSMPRCRRGAPATAPCG